MCIDDIYFPAVEGDLELLRQRLEQNELDLNELIDCGVNNGQRTKVPLIYSVLNTMQQNGSIHYDALEMLIQYGVDLNVRVELSSDASQMYLPVLLYALVEWKNRELLEFLLKQGANPNATRLTRYSIDAFDSLNMLFFAIKNNMLPETELLLQYGADPNELYDIFLNERNLQQELLLLYYATVVQKSKAFTQLLLEYGADVNKKLDVGGHGGKYVLSDYLQQYYYGAYELLRECLNHVDVGSKLNQVRPTASKGTKKERIQQHEAQTETGNRFR